MDDRVTRVAWLNRSTILYAGNDKWSIDNRVVILSNTKTQYSIKIHNVDIYDEGPYTCSVQTDNHPKTSRVHLIVQGRSERASCCCWMVCSGRLPGLGKGLEALLVVESEPALVASGIAEHGNSGVDKCPLCQAGDERALSQPRCAVRSSHGAEDT